MTQREKTLEELLARTERVGDCLIWQGAKKKSGYGNVWHGPKSWNVHRLVYHMVHGELPQGQVVRHTCDTPSCINPNHLVGGTQSDNIQDIRRQGKKMGKPLTTQCKHGHPWTEENTLWVKNRQAKFVGAYGMRRVCRTCSNRATRASRAKARAASKPDSGGPAPSSAGA